MTDDEQFRRFADKLADAVLVHINTPGKEPVSNRDNCRCPLGVRTGSKNPFPGEASRVWEIAWEDARRFMCGFDEGRETGPYADLGRAYRARFP